MSFLILVAFVTADPSFAQTRIKVAADAANIRSGPGTQYAPILLAEQGTIFDVSGRRGSWYEIRIPPTSGIDASMGYIHTSTVFTIAAVPTIAPNEAAARESSNPVAEGPLPPEEYPASYTVDAFEQQRSWSDRQWREYERYKKSEFAAAGLEWIIPMLGYAYVDKASDGLTPALVSLGGIVAIFISPSVGDTGSPTLAWTGLVAWAGGRVWGIVNALEYADMYNRELVRRISFLEETDFEVVVSPSSDGSISFGVRLTR